MQQNSISKQKRNKRTIRSKVRSYIRKYLQPMLHHQYQYVEIGQQLQSKIPINIIKFIKKLKKLYPLHQQQITKQSVMNSRWKHWQSKLQISTRTRKYFDEFDSTLLKKKGSAQHAESCCKLSTLFISGIDFPADPIKSLALALDSKLDSNMMSVLDILSGVFRFHGEIVVGNKEGKRKLSSVAERVLSRAHGSREIHLGEDAYKRLDL